jgi:hypothetical protein
LKLQAAAAPLLAHMLQPGGACAGVGQANCRWAAGGSCARRCLPAPCQPPLPPLPAAARLGSGLQPHQPLALLSPPPLFPQHAPGWRACTCAHALLLPLGRCWRRAAPGSS